MSIVFLGTSNCIIADSFVDTVRELADEDVINASLGTSRSRVGLYCLDSINLSPGDVVILDYTITDGYHLPTEDIKSETILKDIFSIVDYVISRGCFPVMLHTPCAMALEGPSPSEIIHTSIRETLRLPFIHISEVMRRARARGCGFDSLMRDNSHQSAMVTPIVGGAIIQAVARARALGSVVRLDRQPIWRPRTLAAAPLVEPCSRIAFSSRLRSSEMAIIRLGDKITFDVKHDETALGLVVNMGGPGAKVRLSSPRGEEIRDWIFDWENDNPSSYMAIFVALRTELGGGPVQLEVLPIDGPSTQPDLFPPAVLDGCYEEVSVEGLVVGTDGLTDRVIPNLETPTTDLLTDLYDELVEAVCVVVARAQDAGQLSVRSMTEAA